MMSARARSAAAALLLVAVEANVKDKFWGFLEDVSNEKRERSDVTTIAELLDQGAGVHVESCGGKSDAMTVSHADFIRASLQVRAYGSLSRNVSGGTLHVKMYKGSAAKGSSTEDWLKREMAWHSVPHAYEEDLCKHFSKSHSRRACPLPAGDTELRLALDKLPPMVVAGAYKLKIKATDEAGKSVACLRAQVDVPRGKSGELFRRVEALPTAPSGRTLSAHGQCMCGPSDPVCGDDGRTYAGACEAGCANVGVAYPGSCAGPARLGERELDRRTSVGCWYDYTSVGAADCDAAWDMYSVSCTTLEDRFAWDCSGCTCTGDTGAICADTDSDATDAGGYGCSYYGVGWCCPTCLQDDSDFTALDMCCACGGGTDESATTTMPEETCLDLTGDYVFSCPASSGTETLTQSGCQGSSPSGVSYTVDVGTVTIDASGETGAISGSTGAYTITFSGGCVYTAQATTTDMWVIGEETTTDQACEDSYSDCPSWTMNNECEYDWYQENCAMSCGKCMESSCPATCYGRTCDEYVGWGYTCDYVETEWLCDCSGCDCAVSTPAPTTECVCTEEYDPVCVYGYYDYDNTCYAECDGGWNLDDLEYGTDYVYGTCSDEECVCTEEYDPVCLYDYYNYQNTCYAECDGFYVDYIDSDDWYYGTCSDVSGVAPRGLALLFSLSLAALPQ